MHQQFGTSRARWVDKPYPEIVDTAAADGSVLVLPVGSVEQHGHHLPVATDTILVSAVAALGAGRVADEMPVLVAPAVWTGYAPHHLPFGGTLSLSYRTLLSVLEDVAASGLENGFDAVCFLNGHGGNAPAIEAAVSTVGADHPDSEVLGLTYFELAGPFAEEVRDSDPGGMAHGGEFETSLMEHLRPDLVGDGEATAMNEPYERAGGDLLEGGPLSVYRPFDEYSGTGAVGDPSHASPEKGEELYDRLGDELAAVLLAIHEENR